MKHTSRAQAPALAKPALSMALAAGVHRAALAGCLALCVPALALASPVCQWVDAQGRIQIAEVVPDDYRLAARCTDYPPDDPPLPSRQALPPGQADGVGTRAENPDTPPVTAPEDSAVPAAAAPPRPVQKRPAQAVTATTDCGTWWRLYDESAACFGPFRTVRGAIKVEAFEVCNAIESPEPKCGLRSD